MSIFRRPKLGPHAPSMDIDPEARKAITEAQQAGRDAVFHGACLGCIWQPGNATGENLRWCMGCAMFDFNDLKPNRCLEKAR
jgi:hypothetical protein